MNHRTCDADFGHTTPMQLVVPPAEVAGSTAGHLPVDLVRSATRVVVPKELLGQKAGWPFDLENVWWRPKTAAFGVQRSKPTVSACAKSRSQRIL
jgi:hypothetical protein